MDSYPFLVAERGWRPEDIERLSPLLDRLVAERIAGCRMVRFFAAARIAGQECLAPAWQQGVAAAVESLRPVQDRTEPGRCFVPLFEERLQAVVVVERARPWREEALAGLARAMPGWVRAVRRQYLDPLTGLPGGQGFAELLGQRLARRKDDQLLALLEVCPRAQGAAQAAACWRRGGEALAGLLDSRVLVGHVGCGVFGILWPEFPPAPPLRIGEALRHHLHRQGFRRGGVGMVVLSGSGRRGAAGDQDRQEALERAWHALAAARQRGPFGLCVLKAGVSRAPELFPLPGAGDQARLSRLYRGRDRFVLLLVRQDQPAVSNHFTKRLQRAVAGQWPVVHLSQREAFVVLADVGEAEALAWLEGLQQAMAESGGSSWSAGMAVYPCLGYRKRQIAINCRKALRHATLLGPGRVAVFDAVSLNISGDAYYDEGDLSKAAADYRQGLRLDPANVNLLNSLGVAYVHLRRPRQAQACFQQVLAKDPDNFMALYNLGLLRLENGQERWALRTFQQALQVERQHQDLLFQAGRLCCRLGEYQQAVSLLEECLAAVGDQAGREGNGDRGRLHRWLAIGYAGLGQERQARISLEKALAVNPRDAEALSRLGVLYFQQGQGEEVARSLCVQAVTLEPRFAAGWQRLGWLQERLGDEEAAEKSLRRALRLDRNNGETLSCLGRLYARQGKKSLARRLLVRAAAEPRPVADQAGKRGVVASGGVSVE